MPSSSAVLSPFVLFAILGYFMMERALNKTVTLTGRRKRSRSTVDNRWFHNKNINKPFKVYWADPLPQYSTMDACRQWFMNRQQSHQAKETEKDSFQLTTEDMEQTGHVWMYCGSQVTRTGWTKPSRINLTPITK